MSGGVYHSTTTAPVSKTRVVIQRAFHLHSVSSHSFMASAVKLGRSTEAGKLQSLRTIYSRMQLNTTLRFKKKSQIKPSLLLLLLFVWSVKAHVG